jgi:ABC-2 type transport system permease protein
MRSGFSIWRREVGSGFLSPVAYVVIVLFLVVCGWVFLQLAEGSSGTAESLPSILLRVVVFLWLPVLVTVITMRTFAEEKQCGTLETLLTAPVTEAEVVLGKYAGALTFLLLVTLPAFAALFILIYLSPGLSLAKLDWGELAGGAFFLALVASNCTAIGVLVSLLTHRQVVAAVACFAGILAPLIAGQAIENMALMPPAVADYVSAEVHMRAFSRGIVDSRPIVLYVSTTVFLLFTSIRILEIRRWR